MQEPDSAAQPGGLLTAGDEGIGIAPSDLPHVFGRFRRGSNVSRGVSGSGIGLSSVVWVVQQHGGTISIASRAGMGTTVAAWLPPQPAAGEAEIA